MSRTTESKPRFGKKYRWKNATFSIHRFNSPKMAAVAKAFENANLTHRFGKGLCPSERRNGLIADFQIEDEHVYLLVNRAIPHSLDQLRADPEAVAFNALLLACNGMAYWYNSPVGMVLAEAVQKRVRPSIHALLRLK